MRQAPLAFIEQPTKTCFKCGSAKPLVEFYRHPQMADGTLNKCKECAKADVRNGRADRGDYYRQYDKTRYQSEPRKKHALEQQRKYRFRHPLKDAAHRILNQNIKTGHVKRQPCEVCGSLKSEGHHDDYSKPLDVKWLCLKHHRERHRVMSIP